MPTVRYYQQSHIVSHAHFFVRNEFTAGSIDIEPALFGKELSLGKSRLFA